MRSDSIEKMIDKVFEMYYYSSIFVTGLAQALWEA